MQLKQNMGHTEKMWIFYVASSRNAIGLGLRRTLVLLEQSGATGN